MNIKGVSEEIKWIKMIKTMSYITASATRLRRDIIPTDQCQRIPGSAPDSRIDCPAGRTLHKQPGCN